MLTQTKTLATVATVALLVGEASANIVKPFNREFDESKYAFVGVKGGKFDKNGFNKETGQDVFAFLQNQNAAAFAADSTADNIKLADFGQDGGDTDFGADVVDVVDHLVDDSDDDDDEESETESDGIGSSSTDVLLMSNIFELVVESPAPPAPVTNLCDLYRDWTLEQLNGLFADRDEWALLDCDFDGYENGWELINSGVGFNPYVPNYIVNATEYVNMWRISPAGKDEDYRKRKRSSTQTWQRQKRVQSDEELIQLAYDAFLNLSNYTGDDVFAHQGNVDDTKDFVNLTVEMNTLATQEEQDAVNKAVIIGVVTFEDIKTVADGQSSESKNYEWVRTNKSAMVYDFYLEQSTKGQVYTPLDWFNACRLGLLDTDTLNNTEVVVEMTETTVNNTISFGSCNYNVYNAHENGKCPPAISSYVQLMSEVSSISVRRRSI